MRLPWIPELCDAEPELCQLNSPRRAYDPGLHILDTMQMHNVRSKSRDDAQKFVRRIPDKSFLLQRIERE